MARQSTRVPVPVLLTRPLAQSEDFARALVERFGQAVQPVIAPLMEVEPLRPAVPGGPYAGVIFTSANAVAAVQGLGDLPALAWCVGGRTAQVARAAGFDARSSEGDAARLVAAIQADPPPGPLLHLRGEETRGDVTERLVLAGIKAHALTVYRQVAQPMPAAGHAVLTASGPVIVPLFSPESGRRLVAEMPTAVLVDIYLVVMSTAVEQAVTRLEHAALWVARKPDARAMLDAVGLALEKATAP
jgi:uroporphyrinogen-III synthase